MSASLAWHLYECALGSVLFKQGMTGLRNALTSVAAIGPRDEFQSEKLKSLFCLPLILFCSVLVGEAQIRLPHDFRE